MEVTSDSEGVPQFNIPLLNQDVPANLVCETCEIRSSHLVRVDGEVHFCKPHEATHTKKVTSDGRIIPLGDSGMRLVLDSNGKSKAVYPRTEAITETCGWTPRSACLSCLHFRPLEAGKKVVTPWGQTKRETSVIGGSCTLPAEGIIERGRRVHCSFTPKPINLVPSCLNCEFNVFPTENTEHTGLAVRDGVVIRTDLDPWEKEQARRTPEPGLAIWRAREDLFGSDTGLYYTYRANILERKGHMVSVLRDGKTVEEMRLSSIHVKFVANGHEAVFAVDDDGIGVTQYWHHRKRLSKDGTHVVRYKKSGDVLQDHISIWPIDKTHCAVHIKMDPWRENFQLPMPGVSRPYRFPFKTKTLIKGAKKEVIVTGVNVPFASTPAAPTYAERSNWDGHIPGSLPCPRCTPEAACYVHRKGLQWNPVTETYEYAHLHRTDERERWEDSNPRKSGMVLDVDQGVHPSNRDEYRLRIVQVDDSWEVQDAIGNPPHPIIFYTQRRTLFAHAKRQGKAVEEAVRAHYGIVMSTVPRETSDVWQPPNIVQEARYGSFVAEPREHVCVSYMHGDEGIDFKDEGGWLSMGEPRSLKSYQNGPLLKLMADEALRATDIGARLQEIMDATAIAASNYDPITSAIKPNTEWVPVEFTTKKIDLFGQEINEDNYPFGYDQRDDVANYSDWLNETEEVEGVTMSNRERFHGYEISGAGHAQDEYTHPEVFRFSEHSRSEKAQYFCAHCGSTYAIEDVNAFNAICSSCGEPLVFDARRQDVQLFERKGIGTGIHRDSERYIKQRQLSSWICPNWQLRGSHFSQNKAQEPLTLRRIQEREGR